MSDKGIFGTNSAEVTIKVSAQLDSDNLITITAQASWFVDEGGANQAESVRVIDMKQASRFSKAVTVEQFIEATKRDALRELVTQLNIHGVL